MTEGEFHEFGQLSGAAEAPSGFSAAESLGIKSEEARNQIEVLCQGDASFLFPPLLWPALPDDVPAYEQFFNELNQTCFKLEGQVDRLRGQTANRMASNALILAKLNPPQEAVSGFCGRLDQSKDITSAVLAKALEATGVIPEGTGDLAELGVALLIANCSNLISYLS